MKIISFFSESYVPEKKYITTAINTFIKKPIYLNNILSILNNINSEYYFINLSNYAIKDAITKSDVIAIEISSIEKSSEIEMENMLIDLKKVIYPKIMIIIYNNIDYINIINALDIKCVYKMDSICNKTIESQNEIYHIYDLQKVTWGIGDFIRGTIFLHNYYINKNVNVLVDFSNTHLEKFIYCKLYINKKEYDKIKYTYATADYNHDHDNKYIMTNKFYNNLTPETKQYIKDIFFNPRINFKKKLENIKRQHDLLDNEYSIIHIRMEDKYLFENTDIETTTIIKIQNAIKLNENKIKTKKIILISNSKKIMAKINGYIKISENQGHIGHHKTNEQQTESTLIDLFITTTSKYILQLSEYCWGSGFTNIVSDIFDIPITRIRI